MGPPECFSILLFSSILCCESFINNVTLDVVLFSDLRVSESDSCGVTRSLYEWMVMSSKPQTSTSGLSALYQSLFPDLQREKLINMEESSSNMEGRTFLSCPNWNPAASASHYSAESQLFSQTVHLPGTYYTFALGKEDTELGMSRFWSVTREYTFRACPLLFLCHFGALPSLPGLGDCLGSDIPEGLVPCPPEVLLSDLQWLTQPLSWLRRVNLCSTWVTFPSLCL